MGERMKRLFVEVEKCLACRSCEIACAVEHSHSKELVPSLREETKPRSRTKIEADLRFNSFPLQCRHCKDPYCLDACISAALSRRSDTEPIILDEGRCVGCWMCVMVCPFGVIKPGKEKQIALRCDFCQDKEAPVCVTACPTKALFFGEITEFKKRLKSNKAKSERVKKVCTI